MVNLSGQNLGKYQVIDEIGRGGMGTVYRAYDVDLRRHVALKILLPHLVNDGRFLERFRREAVTVANLKHPNIVTVHDANMTAGHYYIVMEMLEGRTLREELERLGTLPLPRATHLIKQLAAALDYAHGFGVIHRDVKASNIVLDEQDHVTLTDFGLVKLSQEVGITQAGHAVGTLKYMAPEQITGETIDHRADIYALGVVIYEIFTGRLPYPDNTPHELIQGILFTPPMPVSGVNPGLPVEIDEILSRALAKNPTDRFDTAGAIATALEQLRPAIGLKLIGPDGREIPLRGLMISLGRNRDNHIVLNSSQISRYHAVIRSEASAWFITDQGSTNGTYINEQRLAARVPHPLRPGDNLRLGNKLTLRVKESEMAPYHRTETAYYE
jgi:serine/threonine-protein kinase